VADPVERDRVNVYEEWEIADALLAFRDEGPGEELSLMIVTAEVRQHTAHRPVICLKRLAVRDLWRGPVDGKHSDPRYSGKALSELRGRCHPYVSVVHDSVDNRGRALFEGCYNASDLSG
jgi:hypothetical protein